MLPHAAVRCTELRAAAEKAAWHWEPSRLLKARLCPHRYLALQELTPMDRQCRLVLVAGPRFFLMLGACISP
jgi:hypothetical protein